jgi:BirA family biotin operon repressor/biotin-[acetyl-CoA-carboxylase] ligase
VPGWQIIELAACGSTNDEAARLARAGAAHGTAVLAHAQDAGRGREGKVWSSPPGAGLYLSIVLRPALPLADVPPLTLAIGVAVCDAAIEAGAAATLKWPNDLLVGNLKLAGVLVETQSQGNRLDAIIAGIGVNLRAHTGLPDTAIALDQASGREAMAATAFAAVLLPHVDRWVDRYISTGIAGIAPAWRARMAHGLSAQVTIEGAPRLGTLAGLDDDGALLLRDGSDTIYRVRSGDVQVVRTVGAARGVGVAR